MESEWDWHWNAKEEKLKNKINLKKEGIDYELWRIWWTIRTTRIKSKIK